MSKQALSRGAEGDAIMAEANKITTKTLFRWKADWETATLMFEKAATCFKNAKEYTKAKEAFKKASLAYTNVDIPFSAAKNMEAAAAMAKEEKEDEESSELFQKASTLYLEHGSPEKAADCLVRAAKVLEESNPEKALSMAVNACKVFETEEKEIFASATFKYSISLVLKLKRYNEAIDLLLREATIHEHLQQSSDAAKVFLSLVIVHLQLDDFVAAQKVWQESMCNGGYGGTMESKAAADLLDAFEKGSVESLQKALAKQTFNFLDNQVIRLAKALKISGDGHKEEESLM